MQPVRLASIALLAALAGVAFAETYRYVYPDGRVVYSDKPVPGARLQGEVAPPPPPGAAPPAPQKGAPKPPGEDPVAARLRLRAEADEQVRQAEQALAQARAQLASGVEPLPGERTGTASGGSRLNEAYDARQRANGQAVAAAQARLERAVAARNATR